jgi:cytochrome P450
VTTGGDAATTMTTADVYYDMYDRAIYANPYTVYRRLRDEAPLYFNEEYGFYAVSRFDDVARVLSDRDVFISGKGGVYNVIRAGIEMPPGMFIFEDPPQHTIHRGLVSRLFTPKAVSGIEPQIRALCAQVVDSLVGAERFDFMKDLALQIPMRVIGMLLGVPESDQAALQAAFHDNMHDGTADPDRPPLHGILDTAHWFAQYLDWRAEHPSDDVMTQLLHVEFTDETGTTRRLQRDEIITYLTLIASAGSDTTATAIGWAGKLLADHPDQRRALVADPSLIPNAVEEVLRFEPPSYHFCRWVASAVEFHGTTVPADSVMVMLPAAANRDDRRYTDPDTFDIRRTPGQIFTFGFGAHFCLGASLARLEARLALEAVLARLPEWTVDEDHATLTGGIDTRGWDFLPVLV